MYLYFPGLFTIKNISFNCHFQCPLSYFRLRLFFADPCKGIALSLLFCPKLLPVQADFSSVPNSSPRRHISPLSQTPVWNITCSPKLRFYNRFSFLCHSCTYVLFVSNVFQYFSNYISKVGWFLWGLIFNGSSLFSLLLPPLWGGLGLPAEGMGGVFTTHLYFFFPKTHPVSYARIRSHFPRNASTGKPLRHCYGYAESQLNPCLFPL